MAVMRRPTRLGFFIAMMLAVVTLLALATAPAEAQRLSQLLRGRFRMPTPLFRPPRWRPKTGPGYNPRRKDWNGVVTACREVGNNEKRMMSFIIRTAFHDALSVDTENCANGNEGTNHARCGGADSSILLNTEEMFRVENAQENFSALVSRAVIKIASFYDVSASDVLAVCTLVGIEQLSGGRVKMIGLGAPTLKVGRLDKVRAAPNNTLPSPLASPTEFDAFWKSHDFTPEEAMALMGSHALLRDQGCLIKGTQYCDPYKESCTDLRMFKWENHFFHEACSPSLTIEFVGFDVPPVDMRNLTLAEQEAMNKTTWCRYTSDGRRTAALARLGDQFAGLVPPDFDAKSFFNIQWTNDNCEQGGTTTCPHITKWPYTPNDAFLAQICQGTMIPEEQKPDYQAAMRKFLDQGAWDEVTKRATIKMMDKYARWSTRATDLPYNINGWECNQPYVFDTTCSLSTPLEKNGVSRAVSCATCGQGECDPCCRCPNAFCTGGYALRTDFAI